MSCETIIKTGRYGWNNGLNEPERHFVVTKKNNLKACQKIHLKNTTLFLPEFHFSLPYLFSLIHVLHIMESFTIVIIFSSSTRKTIQFQDPKKLSRYAWVLLTTRDEADIIRQSSIPMNCLFLVVRKEKETSWKITEIYQFRNVESSHYFGVWSKLSGLQVTDQPFYERRMNLSGVTLLVSNDGAGGAVRTGMSSIL